MPILSNRLIFVVILLPIFQSLNFGFAIGVNFKGMSIAIKNDETNFFDCQFSNTNGCIFDQGNNQIMSCAVMNYLASHNYLIVSRNQLNTYYKNKVFYYILYKNVLNFVV